MQGLRLDGDASLSLAVLLLSQSLPWPDERLDERTLPALGGCARDHDRNSGALVSGAERAQANDGSISLRRWR